MRLRPLLAVPLLAAFALSAAEPPAKHPLTVDDIWAVVRVGKPVVSPDGRSVVYPRTTWEAEKNRNLTDLWLQPVAGGPGRRLTSHEAGESSPAFSPDGTRLAFVSKRDADKEAQLYVLRLDGGEAERWTELPMGVQSPKWTADGKRIVFVSSVLGESLETTKTELARREKDEKTRVKATVSENRVVRYWDHWLETEQWAHLFALDVETRKVTDLTPGMKRLGKLDDGGLSFDVARDGSVVFAANSTEPPYRTTNSDLFLVPAGGGAPRNLTADNPAEDGSPVFSPDGRTIAYGREAKGDGWPDRTRLALLDLATGKTRVLTEEWDSVPDGWSFTPDGKTLVFLAESRARTNVYALPVAGGAPRLVWKGGRATAVEIAGTSDLVFGHTSFRRPTELATVKLDGASFRNLTTWNDALMAGIAFGEERDVVFKGAGGDEVQMFVDQPAGVREGEEVPAGPRHPRRPHRDLRRRVPRALERPRLRGAGLRRGDGELPRLFQLRAGVRRVDPRGAGRQAAAGRDGGDGFPDRRRERRSETDGGGRGLVRRLPRELDRRPDRPLRGAREPRGRLQPPRAVRVRRDVRPASLVRRLSRSPTSRTSNAGPRTARRRT